MSIAPKEVKYLYEMWQGQYKEALTTARNISDELTGDEVAGYRAWWYYLAGSVAWLLSQDSNNDEDRAVAKDLFERAAACPTAISWFSALARMQVIKDIAIPSDELVNIASENIEELLTQLGLHGNKFEKRVSELLRNIKENKNTQFCQGLAQVGELLGYSTKRPRLTEQGAPDCIWQLSDRLCIAIEAKSEEEPNAPIPMRDARETRGHIDWVTTNMDVVEDTEVIVLLMSPRSNIAKDAIPHTLQVYYVSLDKIRSIAEQAVSAARTTRARSTDNSEGIFRLNIQRQLIEMHLDPKQLVQELIKVPLSSLPQV